MQRGIQGQRRASFVDSQTMNVKTVNVLLASSGQGVFNLERIHHQEITQERLACRNQNEH